MTKYQVLRRLGELANWEELSIQEAASARLAIRAAALEQDEGATYVAVPARSWQPVKVAVETALKFS